MHELLRVLRLAYSENLNSMSSLAVGMSICVSTVRMPATAAQTLNLLILAYEVAKKLVMQCLCVIYQYLRLVTDLN